MEQRQNLNKLSLITQLTTCMLPSTTAGQLAAKRATDYSYKILSTARPLETPLDLFKVRTALQQRLDEQGQGDAATRLQDLSVKAEKVGCLTSSKLAVVLELLAQLGIASTKGSIFVVEHVALPAARNHAPSKPSTKQAIAPASGAAPTAAPRIVPTAALPPRTKEPVRVHQVLQVLGGFDAEAIRLDSNGHFIIDLESVEDQEEVSRLCETGRLYRTVRALADSQQSSGKMRNALNAAVKKELMEYSRLLAELHSMAQAPLPAPGVPARGPHLDLCNLDVLLAHSAGRMEVLAHVMVCAAQSPGSIASQLYAFTRNGSHLMATIADRLLQQVCVPLFQMIREWLFCGRMDDAHNEFFIARSGADVSTPDKLWRDGYCIAASRLPPFISSHTAEAILRAGKSIHFLLQCCGDTAWVMDWATSPAAVAAADRISLGQVDVLDRVVAEACAQVDAHLMEVIMARFHFVRHCDVLRRYLLLGQGDYVQALLDLVEPVLRQHASQVSELTLGDLLKQAISSISPSAEDEEVLELLVARKAQATGAQELWQVFSLQYNITGPLATIMEPARQQYLQMFTLLWQFKRAEHVLATSFQMLKCSISRSLSKLRAGQDKAMALAKLFLQFRSTMMHFCSTMQTYLMTEVVESANHTFCRELEGCSNLDHLVACHQRMMATITDRALFGEVQVRPAIDSLVTTIIKFQALANELDSTVTAAVLRVQAHLHEVQQATAYGSWGGSLSAEQKQLYVPDVELTALRGKLEQLQWEYSIGLTNLTSSIPLKANEYMPYLVARLQEGRAV